jgi:hypothetical protein
VPSPARTSSAGVRDLALRENDLILAICGNRFSLAYFCEKSFRIEPGLAALLHGASFATMADHSESSAEFEDLNLLVPVGICRPC